MPVRVTLHLSSGRPVVLRDAARSDLDALVALLVEDPLGHERDGITTTRDRIRYERAFAAIDRDPAHLLVVAEGQGPGALGTLQLSFLPGLARRGSWRAQIEAVRVRTAVRGQGLGSAMIRWAIDEAAGRGCALVQLTSDKLRPDAHRFYEHLGFRATHEGMKLHLPSGGT